MFTPFKDGKVDVAALVATTKRQVEAGIDFLVPLGTTGETPTLSDEEKLLVYKTVRAHAAGKPVVVGVGTNSVSGTLANMELLKDADAFLVVVPFYNKPPQRGIYAYFKEIASHTHKPIILYNVPGRTGANCDAETTLALARDIPNIVAVKVASGKLEQVRSILARRPDGFSVLSGNDDDTLTLMKDGANGVVSVASNVCPREMARPWRKTGRRRKRWMPNCIRSLKPFSWSPIPSPARPPWRSWGSWKTASGCPWCPLCWKRNN